MIARRNPIVSGSNRTPKWNVSPRANWIGLVARSVGTPSSVNSPAPSTMRMPEIINGNAPSLVIDARSETSADPLTTATPPRLLLSSIRSVAMGLSGIPVPVSAMWKAGTVPALLRIVSASLASPAVSGSKRRTSVVDSPGSMVVPARPALAIEKPVAPPSIATLSIVMGAYPSLVRVKLRSTNAFPAPSAGADPMAAVSPPAPKKKSSPAVT